MENKTLQTATRGTRYPSHHESMAESLAAHDVRYYMQDSVVPARKDFQRSGYGAKRTSVNSYPRKKPTRAQSSIGDYPSNVTFSRTYPSDNSSASLKKTLRGTEAIKKISASLVVTWIAYLGMVVCNILFEVLRLGGVTSAEVSNQIFAWFTPAGYVFSIWGVIYLALGIWLVLITRDALRDNPFSKNISGLFILSCALNVSWLIAFHLQQFAGSLVIIIALWAVLALLYVGYYREGVSMLRMTPFSLYLGWITVATLANSAHVITRVVGSIPVFDELSTILLALAVIALGYAMIRVANDKVFPLVLLWGVVGVGVHVMEASMLTALLVFIIAFIGGGITYATLLPSRAENHAKHAG